jgi:hypothetical protein
VDIQVVHNQMNGFPAHITQGELKDYLGELKGGSVWRRECEMTANLGFYATKDVGRAASLVLAA